jgi:hypothetical protein
MEQLSAVRMVPVGACGCGGWLGGSGQRIIQGNVAVAVDSWQWRGGSEVGSGSGWVAVVPLERGARCGSNGTGWSVWLCRVAGWQWTEDHAEKCGSGS